MATVNRENIAHLNDKITVKVSKEDYLPAFEKKLKEYSKSANIPGFRKGMVPAGMIKKMYGAGIFQEEVLRTVETELYKYLDAEKPEIFAQPLPMDNNPEIDFNNPGEYSFDFEIGLRPQLNVPDLKAANLTRHKVEVTDEMLSTEIANMQVKAGKMKDVDSIDTDETELTIALGNTEEGAEPIDFEVAFKDLTPKAQQELKGQKPGKEFSLSLADLVVADKLNDVLKNAGVEEADKDVLQQLTVSRAATLQKRELNESFFHEVYPARGIQTEEELRTALRTEMEEYWNAQSSNQLQDQIYHHLLDNTPTDFPENFLKKWLRVGGEKPKTEEEAEKEYPTFANQLKWTLLSDKLIADHNISVSNEEIKEHMRVDIMRYFGTMNMSLGQDMSWMDSYVDRMMKDNNQVDQTYRRLLTEKLFRQLEAGASPIEKTTTPNELMAMQHNHAH